MQMRIRIRMSVKLSEKHRKVSSFAQQTTCAITKTMDFSEYQTNIHQQSAFHWKVHHSRYKHVKDCYFFLSPDQAAIGETMHQGHEIHVMKSRLVRTGDVNRPWKGSSDMDRITNLLWMDGSKTIPGLNREQLLLSFRCERRDGKGAEWDMWDGYEGFILGHKYAGWMIQLLGHSCHWPSSSGL